MITASELIVDLFAGGGGASTGIEQAIGRPIDIAINHDPEAISMHATNHPQTHHYIADVFEVDPLQATKGRPVGLLWASPACTHFSRARGGVPVSKQLRSLGWVVVRWAAAVRPRIIICENVLEWRDWGPVLVSKGRPCPKRKGQTFKQFVGHLERLGYTVEWKELRACDYGAPTIRKRLFLVARCDGLPVEWPVPTHSPSGGGSLLPWRTAAECIDWSLPCPSIFERKKPLADATLRRIARGVMRYVVQGKPFFVPGKGVEKAAENGHLVSAFLAKHYTGIVGAELECPLPTVTGVDHNSVVTATMIQIGHGEGSCGTKRFSFGTADLQKPLNTITANGGNGALVTVQMVCDGGWREHGHEAHVAALLVRCYGNDREGVDIGEPMDTIPTKDRFGLGTVRIDGKRFLIVDIGMRMLEPHELFVAQGFPAGYEIGQGSDGRKFTKKAQTRMVGNSVCPPVARALVEANYKEDGNYFSKVA